MTTLAMAAKVPPMDVVTTMTGITGLGRDDGLVHAPAVAVPAGQASMGTAQWEVRLAIVLEAPDTPAIGRMTAGTVTRQAALMDIVGLVTIDAPPADPAIAAVEVAVLAARRGMEAEQRETCQVVIEADPLAPAIARVTACAILAQAAGVDVVRGMTGPTAGPDLLADVLALVTGDTVDLAVPAEQGIVEIVAASRNVRYDSPRTSGRSSPCAGPHAHDRQHTRS